MKTGLFFGSFNPIHNGHIGIANYILDFTEVDELWFVVSPHNPLKDEKSLAPDFHRLEMVKLAIPNNENRMMVCDIEMSMPKPSYTIDTVNALNSKFPEKRFVIILGSDSIESIEKWKDYKELLTSYEVMVYPRFGSDTKSLKKKYSVKIINAPLFNFSSTSIREHLIKGENVSNNIPDNVYQYIVEQGLYQIK
ncbi:MAG: nicotinate (nicotinamide) nucleotide adenylyltransferase [Tenuifilaceae bacterium]